MDTIEKLKDLAVNESGFVFDPCSGATYTVNATGLAILEALKSRLGRDEIIARLEQEFDLSAGRADPSRDIDEFVHLLRSHGLVPEDFTP